MQNCITNQSNDSWEPQSSPERGCFKPVPMLRQAWKAGGSRDHLGGTVLQGWPELTGAGISTRLLPFLWLVRHWIWGMVSSFACPQEKRPCMDCSLPDSSVHGIFQARILGWVAISFSRASSWIRDQTWVSCIGRCFLYHWATWETLSSGYKMIKMF